MTPPAEGQINDLARGGDGVEGVQGFHYNCMLLLDVAWLAQRVAERPTQEHASWRLHLLSEFAHNRHSYGGNAGFFDLSLYQANGLIADASGRSQHDYIDLILPEFFHHLFCRLTNQSSDVSAVDVTHEGVVCISQATDNALLM